MILILISILISTLLCFTINFIINERKSLAHFPEPPRNLLFGHILELRSTTDVLRVSSKFIKQYGKTIRVNLANIRYGLVTTDYKFVEYLLSSNTILTKSENYFYLKPWLGYGLLLSDGSLWKYHRKILTPGFHFEILKQFICVFESVGNILIEKLNAFDKTQSLDLYPLVTLCTLDIINETAMGTKINAQQGENSEYVHCVHEMCRITTDRCLSLLKIFDKTYIFTRDYYLQKKILKHLHNFTVNIIKTKKEKINDSDLQNKKLAFLDLLLKFSKEGQSLNDQEIREEVDTFIHSILCFVNDLDTIRKSFSDNAKSLAKHISRLLKSVLKNVILNFLKYTSLSRDIFKGHHTISTGLCFTLFCLANNPEIQDDVLKEQKKLFGDDKNPLIITYQELQEMKYLEMVIKETFRLYPPVPFIGRYTQENIEFDGKFIPKHTNIAIYIYELHRNPEYFPEPEKFDPKRFENFGGSLPYAYIPFSAGSRNCIGQKFAMLEMKTILSKIIRNFEILPSNPRHDLKLAAEAVLLSLNGVKVGLKKRI